MSIDKERMLDMLKQAEARYDNALESADVSPIEERLWSLHTVSEMLSDCQAFYTKFNGPKSRLVNRTRAAREVVESLAACVVARLLKDLEKKS